MLHQRVNTYDKMRMNFLEGLAKVFSDDCSVSLKLDFQTSCEECVGRYSVHCGRQKNSSASSNARFYLEHKFVDKLRLRASKVESP